MSDKIKILAIESSCDETAAAVVEDGRCVKSNIISSQIELHKLYGGVVPEIASRKHVEKVNFVVREALKEAGETLDSIDAIAVTRISVNMPAFSLCREKFPPNETPQTVRSLR